MTLWLLSYITVIDLFTHHQCLDFSVMDVKSKYNKIKVKLCRTSYEHCVYMLDIILLMVLKDVIRSYPFSGIKISGIPPELDCG